MNTDHEVNRTRHQMNVPRRISMETQVEYKVSSHTTLSGKLTEKRGGNYETYQSTDQEF